MGAMAASTVFLVATRPSFRSSKVRSTFSESSCTSSFTSFISSAIFEVRVWTSDVSSIPGPLSNLSANSKRKASISAKEAAGASCMVDKICSKLPRRAAKSFNCVCAPCPSAFARANLVRTSSCKDFSFPSLASKRNCKSPSSRPTVSACAEAAFIGASPPKLTSERGPGGLPIPCTSWPALRLQRRSKSPTRSVRSSTISRWAAIASSFSCNALG